jgi:hypothetical protein
MTLQDGVAVLDSIQAEGKTYKVVAVMRPLITALMKMIGRWRQLNSSSIASSASTGLTVLHTLG